MQLPEHLQYIEFYGDLFAQDVHKTLEAAALEKQKALYDAGLAVIVANVRVTVPAAFYGLYQHVIDDPFVAHDEKVNSVYTDLQDVERYWKEVTGGLPYKYRWTPAGVITLTARLWYQNAYLAQEERKEGNNNYRLYEWEPNHYGQLYPHLPCKVYRDGWVEV